MSHIVPIYIWTRTYVLRVVSRAINYCGNVTSLSTCCNSAYNDILYESSLCHGDPVGVSRETSKCHVIYL